MSKQESSAAEWYVIHTYSGYEKKVSETILRKAENLQMKDMILQVQIPTEDVTEISDGKERDVTRKTYPGYVLVHMIYSDEAAYLIRSIRGVTGFLGADPNKPIALTPAEVESMGVDLGKTVEVDISVGDNVRITGTAMDGFTGVVQSIDLEGRTCDVLVSMFGQQTPTTLAITDVRKMD